MFVTLYIQVLAKSAREGDFGQNRRAASCSFGSEEYKSVQRRRHDNVCEQQMESGS